MPQFSKAPAKVADPRTRAFRDRALQAMGDCQTAVNRYQQARQARSVAKEKCAGLLKWWSFLHETARIIGLEPSLLSGMDIVKLDFVWIRRDLKWATLRLTQAGKAFDAATAALNEVWEQWKAIGKPPQRWHDQLDKETESMQRLWKQEKSRNKAVEQEMQREEADEEQEADEGWEACKEWEAFERVRQEYLQNRPPCTIANNNNRPPCNIAINNFFKDVEAAFSDYSVMQEFPVPPAWRCQRIACATSKQSRALDACSCNIRYMFAHQFARRASLKIERLKYHPDKFGRCPEALRKTFQKMAGEIFVVVDSMYQG